MDTGPDFFLDVLCLAIFSNTEESKNLVNNALEMYNAESAEHPMMNDAITKFYMGILREMVNGEVNVSNPNDVAALLMKFKHNPLVDKDPSLLKTVESMFTTRNDVPIRRVQAIVARVRNWLVWSVSNTRLRKMFTANQKLAQTSDPLKQKLLLTQMEEHGREFIRSFEMTAAAPTTNLGFIDMSCPISVARTVEQHSKKKRGGILKMGWQGLNKAFGEADGHTRGEFTGFGASSHNYKSGILMDIARWIVTHNDAPRTSDRIPCLVFISLENEIDENMLSWFKVAYSNIYNNPPPADMSHRDIIKFVVDVFSRRGWKVFVYREMGEDFGYPEWVRLHTDLSAKGFEIVASILDYITLMKMGDGAENSAMKAQTLANRIGNFSKHNNFSVFTGLQLNSEADILNSSGQINVVKRYGASHLADSKGYKKELDVLFFIKLEKNHQGRFYITVMKDKHRYEHHTPDKDKYFAYPFPPAESKMPILDDINEQVSRSVADIYADGADSEAAPTNF